MVRLDLHVIAADLDQAHVVVRIMRDRPLNGCLRPQNHVELAGIVIEGRSFDKALTSKAQNLRERLHDGQPARAAGR